MYPYPLFQRSYQWSLCIVLLLSLLFCWWTTALKSQSPETAVVDGVNLSLVLPDQLILTQSYSLTWEYQLSFHDSELKAHWVMKKVYQDLSTSIAIEPDISDDCQIIGDVTVIGTQAHFNGGYIACTLPSFREQIVVDKYGYTPDGVRGICFCNFDQVTPPWVAAKFKRIARPYRILLPMIHAGDNLFPTSAPASTLSAISPISYLAGGFEYGVGINDDGMEFTELLFDNHASITNVHSGIPDLWATTFTGYNSAWIRNTLQMDANEHHAFLNIPGFLDAAMSHIPATSFHSWPSIPHTSSTSQLDYEMEEDPQMIYIGGHPDTTSRFKGLIEKLSVDPGCQGGNGPD